MATNNDLYDLLNNIRGNMATKSDVAHLQQEVTMLRDENQSQKDHIRCLRADIANMRSEVDELRAATREEMWEGIEQVKEEVVRWGVSTQQELWDGGREVKKSLADIERGVEGLLFAEIQRLQDKQEEKVNIDQLRAYMDKMEAKLKSLRSERTSRVRDQNSDPRKNSGVSCKGGSMWFANGL